MGFFFRVGFTELEDDDDDEDADERKSRGLRISGNVMGVKIRWDWLVGDLRLRVIMRILRN